MNGRPQGGMKSEAGRASYWRMQWESAIGALADLIAENTENVEALATAGLMETQHISPECRANRTTDGAWDEAVRRLREIYDAQVQHDPAITLGLSISRVKPPDPAVAETSSAAVAAGSET